jgi:hypothetical protein
MKTVIRSLLLFILLFGTQFIPISAHADVPSLINFRGRLVDSLGAPINGSATAQVKLFDAQTDGQLIYEETIGDIQLQQGNYSFQFGNSGTPALPTVLQSHADAWLEVKVGDNVLPRRRLVSVPYALRANIPAGSITKDMLSSELVLELSGSGEKSGTSGGDNSSIDGGVVVAVPPSENPPEGATLLSIGSYNSSVGKSDLGKILTEEFVNSLSPRGGSLNNLINHFFINDKIHFLVYSINSHSKHEGISYTVYDPNSNKWQNMGGLQGGLDKWIKSAYYSGVIYFIAEDNSGGKSLHSYDMNAKAWESLPSPPFKNKFREVGGFLCADNGSLFYFGGYSSSAPTKYNEEAFKYDILSKKWTDIPVSHDRLESGVVREGKAYLNQRNSSLVYDLDRLTSETIKHTGNAVQKFFF